MSQSVRIVNSVRGSGWTSAKNAAKYVTRGLAVWEGKAIRMIETDYRFNANPASKRLVTHWPAVPQAEPDPRTFERDFSFWDGRGCIRFWRDQSSLPGRLCSPNGADIDSGSAFDTQRISVEHEQIQNHEALA